MLVVASETNVRGLVFLPSFLSLSTASIASASQLDGNVAARVRPTRPLRWHTLTVWRDEAAMRPFVRAPEHAAAMRETARLTTLGRFARFEVQRSDEATWARALEALRQVPLVDYSAFR